MRLPPSLPLLATAPPRALCALQGRRFSRPKRLNAYQSWVQGYAADAAAQGPQVSPAALHAQP